MLRSAFAQFRSQFGAKVRVLVLTGTLAVLSISTGWTAPVNVMCPVTTDEPVDARITVNYQGKEIGFCCQKCRRQFLANPQDYTKNLTTLAASSTVVEPAPHSNSHDTEIIDAGTDDTTKAATGKVPGATGSQQHDHTTDHGEASNRLIVYLGKFHPVVVHFPVALMITAFVIALAGMVRPSAAADLLSFRLTYLAAAGAIVAAGIGLAAGAGVHYPPEIAGYFSQHRLLGLSTSALAIATALVAFRAERWPSPSRYWQFRVLLLINAVLVAITGHWGAMLVYGPDHFAF
jgi:uncharacterized membrane protein/YHS domain-containing protein